MDVGLAVVPGEEAVAAGLGAVGSRRVEEADGQMGQSCERKLPMELRY